MSNLNLFDYLLLNPNQLLEVEQIPIFSGSLPKFAANPLESLAPSLPLTVSPFSCPPLLSFLLSLIFLHAWRFAELQSLSLNVATLGETPENGETRRGEKLWELWECSISVVHMFCLQQI